MSSIIIGGGPAGLLCAAVLGEMSRKAGTASSFLLLEANRVPGKKLLASGSGQCNFTHAGKLPEILSHYGGREQERFLRRALHEFSNEDVMAFFRDRGCPPLVREDGKVFPASLKAADVLGTLRAAVLAGGGRILSEERVQDVQWAREGFTVVTGSSRFTAKFVVIATGGRSWPGTGSRGDGYRIAASLGHRIVPPRPALAPLFIREYPFAELAGISLSGVNLALWREGRKILEVSGDLLFTHNGLSGPGVLNLSRSVSAGDVLTVNIVAVPDRETFLVSLPAAVRKKPQREVKDYLREFNLPKRLLAAVLEHARVPGEKRCGNLSRQEVRQLGELLTAFPFPVEKVGGFSTAMATTGGVALPEVNPATMESRLVPGLFFAGEVLDIDGETGGYNFQAAFSTGYLCAKEISKRHSQSCENTI